MKKVKVLFLLALAVFVCALSFTTSGCKSTTGPDNDAPQPISGDLFPLVVGHQLVFSGHLRNSSDQEIAGTSAFYEAYMTVTATNAPTPFGTAHVIRDSQLVSPSVGVAQNYYVQRVAATGSGNISFLTNIGLIYRNFNIREGDNIRSDSLQWVVLVNQEEGTSGDGWVAFGNEDGEGVDGQGEWTGQVGGQNVPVQLIVRGKITQENVTTPGGTFTGAYKVTATRKVLVSGQSVSTGTTAELWLVPDIGLVKFIFHADGESGGFYREYESDNF